MRSSLAAAFAAALTLVPMSDARADVDCRASYSKLTAAAARSGKAQDHIAAADCAAKLNMGDDAISHYRKALADRALDADERNEALKALAYQLEARERWQEAGDTWAKSLALKYDPESRLGAARVALQVGDASRATGILGAIDPQSLERPLNAEYWSLKAQILKDTNPTAALDAINRAIAIEDAVYRRVERADLLLKLGRRREAIVDLEYAHRAEPSNASTARSLAYALNDEGRYADAAAMFEEASRADPKSSAELEDWGYALLAAGRRDEAVEKFRRFIDVRSAQATSPDVALADQLWNARRQIREIERDFYASAFFTYRSDAGLPAALLSEQSSLQSAFGAEVGWRAFGLDRPGDLTLFASAYFALTDGLALDRDAPQGALGARWQPLAEHEFFLSLIRLVELGDSSREGWLTQVSFAASEGADWNPSKPHWLFASIEAYANYLLDEPHFFAAAVEGKLGETFALAQLLTLTPHLLIAGETRDDNGTKSSLVEAGGGLSLQHWFCDDHYAGPLCSAELTLQYRRILARQGLGNGDNAVVVSMAVGL